MVEPLQDVRKANGNLEGPKDYELMTLYSNLGTEHREAGDLEQAKTYYDRALAIGLKELGPGHVHVAATYSNLGDVHKDLGNLKQAKEYYHRTLDIFCKHFGPEHLKVATTYSNLGYVLKNLGDLEQAKEYYDRALDICLKLFGPEHVNVATTYSNLGGVLRDLGDLKKAKEYLHRALDISLKNFGAEHSRVATAYSNLGTVYSDLGDLEHAKEYYDRALDISLKLFGPEHVNVATTYSHLGDVLRDLGDLEQAKEHYECVLSIRLKKLGPEHVDISGTYRNLGNVHRDLGDLAQAVVFHQRVLDILLKKLGPDHIDTATTYSNLGTVYNALGDFQKAKEYYGRALAIELKIFEPEHVDVGTTYNNLGSVHNYLGDPVKAKEYYDCALAIALKAVGPEHPKVATTYSNLGTVHSALGDQLQAKMFHDRALAIRLKTWGPDHVDVAATYSNLGNLHRDLGDLKQAKEYYDCALAILLKTLGPEHADVAAIYTKLGTVYSDLGDQKQAKEYHDRASDIVLNKKGTKHADIATSDSYNDFSDLQTLSSVPPYVLARGVAAKAAYQRALETGQTSDKRVKVLLVGQDRVGKTSVARSLKGEPFRRHESSTEGVQIEKPLKHVDEKPWKNSKEEQELTAFHHNCALHISNQLLTEPPKAVYQENDVDSQTGTYARQNTGSVVAKMSFKQESPGNVDDELQGPYIGPNSPPKHAANYESPHGVETEIDGNPDEMSSIIQKNSRPNEKQKNDIPDEILRLTAKNLSKKQPESNDGIWPVFMDFAGQAIYRAIHPIFVSGKAVYVLVVDLTKDLAAIARCCVKQPGCDEVEISTPDSSDTNLDHILRWMDVVHSFKHEENEGILPPVILVGTHADLVQGDPSVRITNVKDIICDTVRDFSKHIIGKTFAVNNTLAGKELDEEDPKISALRQEILKVGDTLPHTRDKVPLKWLQVEDEVYDLASKGTNYVTRQDFKNNICDDICQFEVEGDFEVFLHFLHDRGTVVYHGSVDDPGSLVVLNPKWLIDVLYQIITVEKQKEENTVIRNLRKDLDMYGRLDVRLLDYSCEQLGVDGIKESLLAIVKKFNLLCEYTSKDGKSVYLVPCMLTSKPDDELMSDYSANQGPAPVYVTFNTQYVPGGLFSRLIVLFVEFVQRRIACDQPKLCANFAHFFIGEFTGIDFVCYKRVIKVHVWNYINPNSNPVVTEPNLCSEVLSFLKTSLKRLHEECHWLKTISWDLCARCNLCPPQSVRKTGECLWHGEKGCRHDDCAHYIPLTNKPFVCLKKPSHLGHPFIPPKTWSQALDDPLCQKDSGVSAVEQLSAFDCKRGAAYQSTQSTAPEKVARTVVKKPATSDDDISELSNSFDKDRMTLGRRQNISQAKLDGTDSHDEALEVATRQSHSGAILKEGILFDDDLEELSMSIMKNWMKLGCRLGVSQAKLDEIDARWPDLHDKAYRMLLFWKQENSSHATYRLLCQALCHKFVNRKDLAESICFH